jgi:putative ABC transport system ATP-binding protein
MRRCGAERSHVVAEARAPRLVIYCGPPYFRTREEERLNCTGNGTPSFIRLRKVAKTYQRGKQEVPVLESLDLDVTGGAFEAIMGPSGSGKSTLLNLISGIDRVSRGSVEVGGVDITHHSESKLAEWRARNVGFVFQFCNLVQVLTAFQNVELPLLLLGLPAQERRKRVETVLELVGLKDRQQHFPNQLSGGQEQRVGIARAIVTDPLLIIADEPTGDLDRESATSIMRLFSVLHREFEKTIVMVTHDAEVASTAQVVHRIDKGTLVTTQATRRVTRSTEAEPVLGVES